MYGELVAAVTSLKALADFSKGLMSLHTMAEVQGKAIELNQVIFDAHQSLFKAHEAQTTMIERVKELEGQIAAMKDWDTEKQRYKLVSPTHGSLVFAAKKEMSAGEPPHYLCANCFKNGKPSILQLARDGGGMAHYICPVPACKAKVEAGFRGGGAPRYAEDFPVA